MTKTVVLAVGQFAGDFYFCGAQVFLMKEDVFLVIGELLIEVLIIVNNVICQKVMSVVYFENITVEVTDTDNKSKVKLAWCVHCVLKMCEFPSFIVSCKSLMISFFDGLSEFNRCLSRGRKHENSHCITSPEMCRVLLSMKTVS